MSGFRGFVIAYTGSQPFPALSWAGSRLSVARSVYGLVGQSDREAVRRGYSLSVVLWLCVPVCLCLSGTVCPWSTQIYPGWIQSISVVLWSGRWRADLSCKVVAELYCGSPACCSPEGGTVPPVPPCPQWPCTHSDPVGTVFPPGPGHQGSGGSGSAQSCPTEVCQVWVRSAVSWRPARPC